MASARLTTGSRTGSRKTSPSDRRREADRQRKHLQRILEAAEEALEVAEDTGDGNHAEWLRSAIFGPSYIDDRAEGLRYEIRALKVAMRDQRVVDLCAKHGISIGQLVNFQQQHDRQYGAAPDENPAAAGSPYRGVHLRSQLGRGSKGEMAR